MTPDRMIELAAILNAGGVLNLDEGRELGAFLRMLAHADPEPVVPSPRGDRRSEMFGGRGPHE